MATHKLKTPIHVGGLADGFIVDKLELVSISINFQHPSAGTEVPILCGPGGPTGGTGGRTVKGQGATISCMLRHSASGWIHTVTVSELTGHGHGAKADAMWSEIKKAFPGFEQKILELIAEHLPPGSQA